VDISRFSHLGREKQRIELLLSEYCDFTKKKWSSSAATQRS
jgi:hypothetical protein